MVAQRGRFLRIWALLTLVWIAGVMFLFYNDLVNANLAVPAGQGVETARGPDAVQHRSAARTAMVALLPPAGTLVTGLALGWFVSRPRRKA